MTLADADRLYVETGLPELQDYLLSNELYWPLGKSLSRLTIGGLLLCLRRLQARVGSQAAAGRYAREMESVRLGWRVAWEKKGEREFHSRLGLWSTFLADYRQSPDAHAGDYPGQVRTRVLLSLLLADLSVPPTGSGNLVGLDDALRAAFLPGAFLWESDVRPAFPPDEFWFLYGRLKD